MSDAVDFWKYGQKAKVAKAAKMNPTKFSALLGRRYQVSLKKAKQLERASIIVLGHAIPWQDWIDNACTEHPAFKPRTQDKNK